MKKRTKLIRPASIKRAYQLALYKKQRNDYLLAHPYCQATIAKFGLTEAEVILDGGIAIFDEASRIIRVPNASQIHHRNKRDGERLLDERWWMSVCQRAHQWIENNKAEAREIGLLLPIQADKDGKWGAGYQAPTTQELLRAAANKEGKA